MLEREREGRLQLAQSGYGIPDCLPSHSESSFIILEMVYSLRPKALPLLGLLNARSDQSTTDGESEGLESGEWRVNNNIYFSGRFCRHLLSPTDMLIALFDRINILEI